MLKILIILSMALLIKADEIKILPPLNVSCVDYSEYSTCYSYDLNRSVYSVEHLTSDNIKLSEKMIRKNSFHEDPYLKTKIQYNFVNSKYDKGHLAPCGNMSNTKSQYESFSMANMIPQYYSNNRGNWKHLEDEERNVALSKGTLIVISGTYGSNGNIKTSDIPKYAFKIFKNNDYIKVYIITNDGNQDINETNIDELSKASGYKFLLSN